MLNNPEKTRDLLINWIRHYMDENGPGCDIVVGISGGKDSSVTAALCTRALGKNRVIGVMMPNGIQSDIEDSRALAAHLGIRTLTVNINSAFEGLTRAVDDALAAEPAVCTEKLSSDSLINLPARLRMCTLYAIAQALPNGGRIANTCNRSEDYIGYSTKYGDAAGDFSPLANILVHEVIQLGEVLGLPGFLIHKTPADGLSGMSDEEKIGFTYAELDHYILTGRCTDEKTRAKIDRMHRLNLHKLQLMPSFRL